MAAAALGTGELFLRLCKLDRPGIAAEWDFYDYRRGSLGGFPLGVELPEEIKLEAVQVGAGSVGGGFDYVVADLPLAGHLAIVDPELALEENYGPHPLMGIASIGPKVEIAKQALRAGRGQALELRAYAEPFRFFGLRLGVELPRPKVVISALDRVRPRHQVQRLWADLHIDAATGGLQSQVIVRTNPGTGRCLIESFDPGAEPEEEESWSEMTGLTKERLIDPMAPISDADVESAPAERRACLAAAKKGGGRVCNVVVSAELGVTGGSPDFAAATPFNALLAGTLAAAELVKSKGVSRDGAFAQFNFLNQAFLVQQTRSSERCECADKVRAG